jgi:acyl-CoA synthetase (AMP-forming)/AMP-acid ligase II
MSVIAVSPYATPGEALRDQVARRPERPAQRFPTSGAALTFAQWLHQAERVARGLLDLGVRPGEHVALLAENRIEWPVVQMACALGGFVLVPLNSHYRRDDLAYALAQSDSVALFLSESFRSNPYLETLRTLRPSLPKLRQVICLDRSAADAMAYRDLLDRGEDCAHPLPDVASGAPAALLYTSGTTGQPKGALLDHRGMLGNAWGTATRLAVGPDDRWISIIPLFHCAGCIMSLLGCLQKGACMVGVPAYDPVTMFRAIESERCTLLSGVPTSFIGMLNHAERTRHDLSSLRAGTCGGADADAAILGRCAHEFPIPYLAQVYGQTEVNTLVACPAIDDEERFATAGRPLPGLEVRVTDPQSGALLPAATIGQIEARGPLVMLGYYNKPAETAETIARDGWLKTGDLGMLTPEGRVVIAGGRLRDMIIRGGENIYPAEIENLLRRHPAIGDVAVFGVTDDYYGEAVAAAVMLKAPTRSDDLRGFFEGRIARFKLPARFYVVRQFPATASGKIRKTELRRLAESGALEPLT